MNIEQVEALARYIARAKSVRDRTREQSERLEQAYYEALGLLVEPEQTKHKGKCVGGPHEGHSMAMDAEIIKGTGGEYQWNDFAGAWYWEPDVDPELTTFGELEAGEWFRLGIGNYPMVKTHTIKGRDLVAIDTRGHSFSTIDEASPVRRLPQPEWSN